MNGYSVFFTEIDQQLILEDRIAVVLAERLSISLLSVIQGRVIVMANITWRLFFAYVFDKIVWAGIKSAVVDIENLANGISKILIDNNHKLQWTYR